MRLCLGTLINILYYNRNNGVKVDLVCDSIASSYGVDLSEIYYERNNYDKLKAGRNNTPNEISNAARSITRNVSIMESVSRTRQARQFFTTIPPVLHLVESYVARVDL